MTDIYSTEPERQAALAEVTKLRRQFDTTTAKGAAAFAKSKEAQDALKRLDASKTAAGMRTSKQDLAALNKYATSNVATADMTPAQRKEERVGLNQPSRQYFAQVQEAYKNPDKIPTWNPTKTITPQAIEEAKTNNFDLSNARYDWIWTEQKDKKPQWAVGLIGVKMTPPPKPYTPGQDNPYEYALRAYASDSITAGEWSNFVKQNKQFAPANTSPSNPFGVNIVDEIIEALPNIRYSEIQEIIYRLTLEKDTDITIEDLLDKYDELYGEG